MAWNSSPGGPPNVSTGSGDFPARIWTPGATTSGFTKLPAGPREEKAASTSGCAAVAWPGGHVAVTPPGWAARKASSCSAAGRSRWTAGSQWLSVSTSCTAAFVRSIPAAPPCRT